MKSLTRVLVVWAVILATLGLLPAEAEAVTRNAGWELRSGSSLYSDNGSFELRMQADGNLVLYRSGGGVMWNTGTYGRGVGPYRAKLQSDGNFVLYDSRGSALWSSQTWNKPGAVLALQNDGNLVLYRSGSAIWNTGTGGQTGTTGSPPASSSPFTNGTCTASPAGERTVTVNGAASLDRRWYDYYSGGAPQYSDEYRVASGISLGSVSFTFTPCLDSVLGRWTLGGTVKHSVSGQNITADGGVPTWVSRGRFLDIVDIDHEGSAVLVRAVECRRAVFWDFFGTVVTLLPVQGAWNKVGQQLARMYMKTDVHCLTISPTIRVSIGHSTDGSRSWDRGAYKWNQWKAYTTTGCGTVSSYCTRTYQQRHLVSTY